MLSFKLKGCRNSIGEYGFTIEIRDWLQDSFERLWKYLRNAGRYLVGVIITYYNKFCQGYPLTPYKSNISNTYLVMISYSKIVLLGLIDYISSPENNSIHFETNTYINTL
jgi:hypothetical protein